MEKCNSKTMLLKNHKKNADETKLLDNNDTIIILSSSSDEESENENNERENSMICIRYDFDKVNNENTNSQESSYTRSIPLYTYLEESKKNNNNMAKNISSTRSVNVDFSNKQQQKNGWKHQKTKIFVDYSTPLSPESQKKELCSYLQLMKPGSEKKKKMLENRRSIRVQNLKPTEKQCEKADSNNHETVLSKDPVIEIIEETREIDNKLLPLPPKQHYEDESDFENSISELLNQLIAPSQEKKSRIECDLSKKREYRTVKTKSEMRKKRKNLVKTRFSLRKNPYHLRKNRQMRKLVVKSTEKRKKFKFETICSKRRLVHERFNNAKRINSLRSKGMLRNVSLDKLVLSKKKKLEKKKPSPATSKTDSEQPSPEQECEVITIQITEDDENVDLKNFVDDMLELDKMSEEHRKSVIENRILASINLIEKNQLKNKDAGVQKACKIFTEICNEHKGKENTQEESEEDVLIYFPTFEHNYAQKTEVTPEIITIPDEDETPRTSPSEEEIPQATKSPEGFPEATKPAEEIPPVPSSQTSAIEEKIDAVPLENAEIVPAKNAICLKSTLHRNLTHTNHKRKFYTPLNGSWSPKNDNKKVNHSISISRKEGEVLKLFYQDYYLIIIQEKCVSIYTQSALGNVLGAQNMWIPNGQTQRLSLNSRYLQKETTEMVIATENSVAYVELWMKEHKSDFRERPLADVFVTVYFWRIRQNGIDKKALQLESIQGYSKDVKYVVMRATPRICVSWHSVQLNEKTTKIRSYYLATDFQTVASINEIQAVNHYVSSLHNIEDCDNLIMGCGENKITVWNLEYGYIVATVELLNVQPPLSTQWVKNDRGYLFVIQECNEQELRLMAINGMNHSWKTLQNYNPPPGFDGLKGVYIENGLLVAYYCQGIVCWNAQTGQLIIEEGELTKYIPSQKHVIILSKEQIIVRHSLSHLITAEIYLN